jgi:signal transduction histidine kinase
VSALPAPPPPPGAPAATPAPAGRRESALQRRPTLGDLLDAGAFTEVVRSFSDLYKIGVKVFDEKGGKLADIKVGNGDFCGYVFSFPEGRHKCMATVARVKDGPLSFTEGARPPQVDEPAAASLLTVPCFTGLRYMVLPVLWEGDLMGRIVFGPFTPADLQGLPESLTAIGPLDLARAEDLMARIRPAPESAVARVMQQFLQVLEALVASGQKVFLTSNLHIEATLETNRQLEEQNRRLEEMNARLKEVDRLKSSFLATVSHELRTPLTSIIGYSEMLAEGLAGPLNGEQDEYVRTIMDKGETLLKLISSILDLSQIEAGKVRLVFEPVELVELVTGGVTSVLPQAQKKGVKLQTRLPPAPVLGVMADRDRLRQVVVNLLANAVKFTAKDGAVSLLLSPVGPQPELGGEVGYRMVVEDTGVGIPPEHFDKIFRSFYQVDGSSTREFGGAGLGLAIVKSFVDGHGGQVRVSSELRQGSRFTVVLPARPPEPKTHVQVSLPSMDAEEDRF